MNRAVRFARIVLISGAITVWTANSVRAADWPMWGYDAARSGVSPDPLPEELHLDWILRLRRPDPAWHAHESKVQFDRLYEPIVADGRLYIGSMTSDRMTAYDARTGEELWRFYTDGPVRFAPAVADGRVYFVSDDGYLYCLRGSDGGVIWKFKGGPSQRKLLGNDRLIDMYPARGAPVLYDGDVYFAASIWPMMGVFIHALDAETGEVRWTNSGTGSMYIPQQHDGPAFAGVTPQGYLAATDDVLLVAGGQTVPAALDRRTGEMLHYNLKSRRMGSKGGGGYRIRVADDFFVNRGDMFRLADGKFLAKANDPLIPASSLVGVDADGKLFAYERGVRTAAGTDQDSSAKTVSTLRLKWSVATTPSLAKVFAMAGERLYGTAVDGRVVAVDVGSQIGLPKVAWSSPLPATAERRAGTALNMIAAEDRLYVSTDQGEILCFAEPRTGAGRQLSDPPQSSGETTPVRTISELPPRDPPSESPPEPTTRVARQMLKHGRATQGYCLVLGIGNGHLLDALIAESQLNIVACDPDREKVARVRRRLDAAGIYGSRVEVFAGDIHSLKLSPYLANLIVSADLSAAGADAGQTFFERVFEVLRPYGGVACFATREEEHARFADRIDAAELPRGEFSREDGLSMLRRVGSLPGSGKWTHHNGDSANSVFSSDQLVRAPLGILWFGGPSNEDVLPRHGHGPAPQVVGGRLFIEGAHLLRAVDVYNGLVLWEREFTDLGKAYTSTDHAPGAGAVGGNYVAVEDAVYVIHGPTCYHLDPATGETRGQFSIPADRPGGPSPDWGFLAVSEDVLIGGVAPYEFTSHAFTRYEMRKYYGDRAKPIRAAIASWSPFEHRGIQSGESEPAYIVDQLNRILYSENMLDRIPAPVRADANVEPLEKELRGYLAGGAGRHGEPQAIALKRRLLEAYYSLPRYRDPAVGRFGNSSRTASHRLVGLDRKTGKLLWQVAAQEMFRHNAIAAGNGMVFALDRLPADRLDFLTRRGTPPEEQRRIIALDLRTGERIWHTTRRIFGTWLGYSTEHDVLLQAGSAAHDRAIDEVGEGMAAYRGRDGDLLWENDLRYSGPCILLHDTILTQADPGMAINLLTGVPNTRIHPLTGVQVPWSYSRNRGCNTAIASEHLITFRSSAAGFFDLAGDGGTGNLGGFRSGCTSNLIPADGVLSAPDYTRTCTCAFQNRTSLALVHMPDVQMWTFNRYPWNGERVRRLGLNFGAPGDCRDPNGLMWLDVPSVGGDSPDVPVRIEGPKTSYFRFHHSRIHSPGEDRPAGFDWVASSGLRGASSITITLAKESAVPERPYTVRLYFADVDAVAAGERVFDIRLQGEPVALQFDIVAAAGGPNRLVRREFTGVAAGHELRIDLVEQVGQSLLCGIELVAEGR